MSRLLPLCAAGLVCFVAATLLGYGGWHFFGTRERAEPGRRAQVTQTTLSATALPPEVKQVRLAPAGEVFIPGGEVSLGGDTKENPARREFLKSYAIAETEVTNEQYREFVKATGHRPPAGWVDGEFPPGAAHEPVTGVVWQDAADYCNWLSAQVGAKVRLPTEAEWELAAKGKDGFRYPWGNDWNERAADTTEKKSPTGPGKQGRVRAVKSFPENRSPFGAYDMAGNVWEWVAEEARDLEGNPRIENGVTVKIIKGGSAGEPREFITTAARFEVMVDQSSSSLGFRYVVERDRDGRPGPDPGPKAN
jgi:formylglycine-generating enzyme required for sulfatase activity